MRDVLRANVFDSGGTIIWSSDRSLVGQRFADNDELEAAMGGELVVHAGQISESHRGKPSTWASTRRSTSSSRATSPSAAPPAARWWA